MHAITEDDLRLPEFRGVNLSELERNASGAIVRKDRWETCVRAIVGALGGSRRDFDVSDIRDRAVAAVQFVYDWQPFDQTDDVYLDIEGTSVSVFNVRLANGSVLTEVRWVDKGWVATLGPNLEFRLATSDVTEWRGRFE